MRNLINKIMVEKWFCLISTLENCLLVISTYLQCFCTQVKNICSDTLCDPLNILQAMHLRVYIVQNLRFLVESATGHQPMLEPEGNEWVKCFIFLSQIPQALTIGSTRNTRRNTRRRRSKVMTTPSYRRGQEAVPPKSSSSSRSAVKPWEPKNEQPAVNSYSVS